VKERGITIKDLGKQTLIMMVGRTAWLIDGSAFYRGIEIFPSKVFCDDYKLVLGAKEDKLYVSAEFKDLEKEEMMGIIEFNHWKLYKENVFSFNNDDETLEVRDKQNNIAFAISYGRLVHMKGVLVSGYFIGDSSTMVLRTNIEGPKDTQFCILKSDPAWKNRVMTEISKQRSYFNR
jgi:hypothetical protein